MKGRNEVLRAAARAALSKKAEDPILLDLRELSGFTDAFLLCHGTSVRQVQAIAGAVEEALLRDFGRKPRVEGFTRGEWILMDYHDLVVHVFTADKRDFFDLERLWGDAPRLTIDDPDSGLAGAGG